MAMIVFPWFRGNFIPSQGHDGYGVFWLYGIKLSNDGSWLPLGDTWFHCDKEILYSVGLVVLWMADWKGRVNQFAKGKVYGNGARALKWKGNKRYWVLGFVIWLWRGSSLITLARQYGIWSISSNQMTAWWIWWGYYVLWHTNS
jgi:hypothetical protein